MQAQTRTIGLQAGEHVSISPTLREARSSYRLSDYIGVPDKHTSE